MHALHLLSGGGEGPNTELLWVLWALLGFFALAVVSGWLSSLRKPEQAGAESEAVSSDDLLVIEGIGPKVAKVLAGAGIRTFDDLARSKKADVQNILDQADLQMMDPAGWIDQAKLAAKGDWTALEKMKDGMKGGRKNKR